MNQNETILGFEYIRNELKELANTKQAKDKFDKIMPYLSEAELRKNMRETTQARKMLDAVGTPPIPTMYRIDEFVEKAVTGELLLAEDMERIGSYLAAVRRLKDYLMSGQKFLISLAYYSDNLILLEQLEENIHRCIRNGRVDDYASPYLHTIRKKITILEERIKSKAESVLRANKAIMTDQFVVTRSGHVCLPVKRDHKAKIRGSVIDQSATGATLFIEPESVSAMTAELELLSIQEDTEVRTILYTLMDEIATEEYTFQENMNLIVKLDFIFAKGKLSVNMKAVEPELHLERSIEIKKGRHPQLDQEKCVPLDFSMEEGTKGVIITGPNTGGKTVAIKTVGLFSQMAGIGLHLPCEKARICMFNQVLCDIGDGQNITDNLSTFSAHITNIIHILGQVTEESLVILDELGSGTDPLEGMGIAIAILEKLRQSGCMYLVTTHYPELKEYAKRYHEIVNASVAFDREQLKPLYRLEIGSAGESCALYIAKKLGLPDDMIRIAAKEAYGSESKRLEGELGISENAVVDDSRFLRDKDKIARIIPDRPKQVQQDQSLLFERGDSVTILPENTIGIVVKSCNKKGEVLVQVQKEKMLVNQKRLKLKVAASELYPENYDFSIIFDSVANRKARRKMDKGQDVGFIDAQVWK